LKKLSVTLLSLCAAALLGGCGNYHRHGLQGPRLQQAQSAYAGNVPRLSAQLEERILQLNPTNVTAEDIRDVLSHAPAPRVVNIHGGLARVIPRMVSFSEFLMGMGYPAVSLTNPSDGTYSFSCYESSEKIAGAIAWFYEKEGLRPMMVGHSQGGFQAVKVLYKFARDPASPLHVWNPLTWEEEKRCDILDPLTGSRRPVVGLQLPYVSSVGAGGLTRVLPNQWDMTGRLHSIPDSVEEFTGFCKGFDLLGGDFMGYGSVNHYKSEGKALVRNVWLPTKYHHSYIPDAKHLLKDPRMVDWINHYHPSGEPVEHPKLDVQFDGDSSDILWAADVWFSIKKHWVLELQNGIRAKRITEASR